MEHPTPLGPAEAILLVWGSYKEKGQTITLPSPYSGPTDLRQKREHIWATLSFWWSLNNPWQILWAVGVGAEVPGYAAPLKLQCWEMGGAVKKGHSWSRGPLSGDRLSLGVGPEFIPWGNLQPQTEQQEKKSRRESSSRFSPKDLEWVLLQEMVDVWRILWQSLRHITRMEKLMPIPWILEF